MHFNVSKCVVLKNGSTQISLSLFFPKTVTIITILVCPYDEIILAHSVPLFDIVSVLTAKGPTGLQCQCGGLREQKQ